MTLSARPRRLAQALGLLLAAGLQPSAAMAAPEQPGLTFERYQLVTGRAALQTVVPGFFLGGAVADIAVVQVGETADRRVKIFRFDGADWVLAIDAALDPEVLFVDVARIGGHDRLITYAPGRLSWLDPDSATERLLVEVTTSYNATASGLSYGGAEPTGPADEGEVPRVDVTRDLNDDGLDDLVLPDVDGFWISTQSDDGSFAQPARLGPPEPFREAVGFDSALPYGAVGISPLTAPWYSSRLHLFDYDRDGRHDLVFWNRDHFDLYRQRADGRFAEVAETFTVDVPFDADGAYSFLFEPGSKSTAALLIGSGKRLERTVLHSFRDLDGDGVADLLTQTLTGRSLLRLRSRYAVHYGTAAPGGGTAFARDAGASIQEQGKAPPGYSSHWLRDLDGDGEADLLSARVRTGLGGMIRALFNTSVTLVCERAPFADGTHRTLPTARRKVRADIDLRGGRDRGFWPSVLIGDVSGDGRDDLLVTRSRQELHVYLGAPGPQGWAHQPLELPVHWPGDERNRWLTDLDRDGRQDLLLHHPSRSEPHRVTVLIAR